VSLREDLRAALTSWGLEPDGGIRDDTPLIESGLLDSLALFSLAAWVEERIGGPLDPASFDLPAEWATPAAIVCFVERRRDGGHPRS
jgi:acyl carrier protein